MQQNAAEPAGPGLTGLADAEADHFDHMLDMQDPCEAVFQSFREMRTVSSAFKEAVDSKQGNEAWLAPLVRRAAEWRNGLQPGEVLAAGAPRGVGLQRLLQAQQYGEIADGMREFAQDPATQREVLRLLQLNLAVLHHDHQHRRIMASTTDACKLQCALARTIRLHFGNAGIVQRAMHVLDQLAEFDDNNVPLDVDLPVCTYIVETMLAVMRIPGTSHAGYVRKGLYIIWTVTENHIPQGVLGAELLRDIAGHMLAHRQNRLIVERGVRLTSRCAGKLDMSREPDCSLLLSCDVAEVEHALLECITGYMETNQTITRYGLDTLASLNTDMNTLAARNIASFRPMAQPGRTLELAVTALMGFGNDASVVEIVVNVALSVAAAYSDPQKHPVEQPTNSSGTVFPGTTFIPIIVLAMRSLPISAATKDTCASLFTLLYILCENHAVHTEFVVTHRVLHFLSAHYEAPVLEGNIDVEFMFERNRFEQLLLQQIP